MTDDTSDHANDKVQTVHFKSVFRQAWKYGNSGQCGSFLFICWACFDWLAKYLQGSVILWGILFTLWQYIGIQCYSTHWKYIYQKHKSNMLFKKYMNIRFPKNLLKFGEQIYAWHSSILNWFYNYLQVCEDLLECPFLMKEQK